MGKRKKRTADSKTAIYLNGKYLGVHPNGMDLAQRLREKRRMNEINGQVNVYYNEKLDEMHVVTDKGRVRRPFIVVENGKSRLTPEIMQKLKNGDLNWNHLVKMGVIEFLDAQEEENAYVSLNEKELVPGHTHLEVDAAGVFGVVTSVLPYSE